MYCTGSITAVCGCYQSDYGVAWQLGEVCISWGGEGTFAIRGSESKALQEGISAESGDATALCMLPECRLLGTVC